MATEMERIEFSKRVEEISKETGADLIESCFSIADEIGIDEEQIASHIHPVLKEKIRIEAISNRTLRVEMDNNLDFLFNQ